MTLLHSILYLIFLLVASQKGDFEWHATLSEWHLFETPLANLQPAEGIIPYSVNAPLYSDYAYKSRFIKLPTGSLMAYHPTDAFAMPNGTILIKNFFYYHDEKGQSKGKRILETRLIVRDNNTWHAMSYRWNLEQTEAYRAIAGGETGVEWTDLKGQRKKVHYLIPDANQCKNCHNRNNELLPLGITARQLNGPAQTNQLKAWYEQGLLKDLPENYPALEHLVNYEDESHSITSRARSYLDANCGHCHSPEGSARTSGLNLSFDETDLHAVGVMKSPVAAGRGSGDLDYSIVPGKPNQSILVYRMESNDPGIRMPEINRQLIHTDGVGLIKEWIKSMSDK